MNSLSFKYSGKSSYFNNFFSNFPFFLSSFSLSPFAGGLESLLVLLFFIFNSSPEKRNSMLTLFPGENLTRITFFSGNPAYIAIYILTHIYSYMIYIFSTCMYLCVYTIFQEWSLKDCFGEFINAANIV